MTLRACLLLLCTLMLAGCPQKSEVADEAEMGSESISTEQPKTTDEAIKEMDSDPISTPAPLPGRVDVSCQTDADCAVKNVGNCCGYFPACVNHESPTYPEQVKAQCEADGRMSVCGFQEISACTCVDNACTAVHGDSLEARPVQ